LPRIKPRFHRDQINAYGSKNGAGPAGPKRNSLYRCSHRQTSFTAASSLLPERRPTDPALKGKPEPIGDIPFETPGNLFKNRASQKRIVL